SKINANWHDWIHYRTDEVPIIEKNQKSWYKEHSMNYTGTEKSYSPRNSSSKKIRSVSKSYESWSPGERK
ncbi:MAG: NADH-ubiquinone oxidoreductase subunit NDUFA12 family protein, partial [Hyphomicrobiales bacterium]|nr:NADH-ubiquinone oxidoreductase subunit NDUFA12 family protein [Hyphomicrobiales bacterium]